MQELEQQREQFQQQIQELEDLQKHPGWLTLCKVLRYQMLAREQEARQLTRQGNHDGVIAAGMSLREADTLRLALAFPTTMLDSLRDELNTIISEQIADQEGV